MLDGGQFTIASTAIGIRVSLFLLDIFGLFAGVALLAIVPKWFSRRLRLQADVIAEDLTQGEALLHVLEKMWTTGLQDQRLANPFNSQFFNGRPSLEERIANLKLQDHHHHDLKLGTILLLISGIGLVSGGFAFDSITDFGTCTMLRLCFDYPLLGTSFDLSPLIVFLGLWPIVHVILELTEKKSDIPPIEKTW